MVEYPADWKVCKLGEKASISRGGSPRPIQNWLTTADNGINWIKIGDVAPGARYITRTAEKIRPEGAQFSRYVHNGDFILSNSMSFGRPYVLQIEGCIHDGWLSIQKYQQTFDIDFLYYILSAQKVMAQYIAMAAGSSVKNLNKDKVKAVEVPIPPLPEQRRIAAVLSNADELIANVEKRIAKKRAIKQGAMQELLGKLKGETGPLGYFETRGYLKLYRGKVISKLDILENPGAFPIYSSSVTNEGLMGKYGLHMFDEELISWSIDGGGNFFYRPRHKFSVTNVCGYMRVDTNKIDYRFFSYELQHLHSFKQFDYQTKAHPSVIRKEYIVVVPELAEQRAIAKVLSGMDAEIANLERKLEKLKLMKQGMMQDLLTGKVRLK